MNPPTVTLESIQQGIEELKRSRESRKWQILTILLPVVVTSLLGLLVFVGQQRVEASFAQQSKELSTKLALTEEYYRRQLDVYQKVHEQMVRLHDALEGLQAGDAAGAKEQVNNELAALSQAYKVNTIYLTRDAIAKLADLWFAGVNHPRLREKGETTVELINKLVGDAEEQMMRDLQIEQLRGLRLSATSK